MNRKDAEGRNIFQGGFLGLDNIGVFDRSAPLPTGGHINQADGTSWMAMYSPQPDAHRARAGAAQPGLRGHRHQVLRALPAHRRGDDRAWARHGIGLWDEEDEFFYDVLHLPDGKSQRLQGALDGRADPAVRRRDPRSRRRCAKLPDFAQRLEWFLNYRPDLAALVSRWDEAGTGERRLLSLLRGHRMKRLLKRMLDETEFLSDYGVRALSRHHREHPYVFRVNGDRLVVGYQPAESDTRPVRWQLELARADLVSGQLPDHRVAAEVPPLLRRRLQGRVSDRLGHLHDHRGGGRGTVAAADAHLPAKGRTASVRCSASDARLQNDPHFRDYLLFHEYFHGDTGRGVGASHQTGWTGLVAKLLQPRRRGLKIRPLSRVVVVEAEVAQGVAG